MSYIPSFKLISQTCRENIQECVPIVMKHEPEVSHCVLGVHTKFQIDISKHVEKCLENFEKSKTCDYCKFKIFKNPPNSQNYIFAKKTPETSSIYEPNLKDLSWFMRLWLQKMNLTYFWLWNRSKWPDQDETQTWHVVLPTKCIYIYQVSKQYLKACWKNVWKTHTDGQMLQRHNTISFRMGI